MSRVDVDYNLDQRLREEIKRVKDDIVDYLGNVKIFLFGSIAKGCYSTTSDIDLLVLLPEALESPRKMRYLKHQLEDRLVQYHLSRSVDLKIYEQNRYKTLCQTPCFEQAIQKDLVNIIDW